MVGKGRRDCSGYGYGCGSSRSSGGGRREGEEVVRLIAGQLGGKEGCKEEI